MLSAYDRNLARRALGIAALVGCVVLLVVTATDEGGGFARRAALCAALAPAAGGIGALAAARIARARGEARALEALGADPFRVMRGAVLGGVIVAAIGPALVFADLADLEPLFPRPAAPSAWIAEPDGGMRDATRGTRLGPGGALEVAARASEASAGAAVGERRAAVGIALVLLAFAAPLGATRDGGSSGRAAFAVLLVVAMIAAFQFVAAGRASAFVVCVPPLVLLAHALVSRYRPAPPR
ncbi:hypothetical protein [Polyangium fumosum]|uniref:Uncharacterized protein n=1 Tax=Polyangium fumosum TaxID=889272 RepID=A0A4U1J0W0_9BACT|nr:hypothetical protein [Polyangium fumosum]TKD00683.1 hypothetical protein E8A74_33815 [Polyangium fumosum]